MVLDQYWKQYVDVYDDNMTKTWCRTFFILCKDNNLNLIVDSRCKDEIGTIIKIEYSNPFCTFQQIKVDQIV